jgi:hypothetical protein
MTLDHSEGAPPTKGAPHSVGDAATRSSQPESTESMGPWTGTFTADFRGCLRHP